VGAAKLPIVIEQGAEFDMVITVVGGPASLAGYTGSMQIRESKASSTVVYEVPSGGITIDPDNRQVSVNIDYLATAGFTWNMAVYDVLITSADETDAHRVAEGKIKIDHSVTRESA
jgi:hypothetical protein